MSFSVSCTPDPASTTMKPRTGREGGTLASTATSNTIPARSARSSTTNLCSGSKWVPTSGWLARSWDFCSQPSAKARNTSSGFEGSAWLDPAVLFIKIIIIYKYIVIRYMLADGGRKHPMPYQNASFPSDCRFGGSEECWG